LNKSPLPVAVKLSDIQPSTQPPTAWIINLIHNHTPHILASTTLCGILSIYFYYSYPREHQMVATRPIPVSSDSPVDFEEAIDPSSGKTYYLNHTAGTTSWENPTLREPFTPGLPYPYESQIDSKGRTYYVNHQTKATSWMHPVKLEELKASGILDTGSDKYGGDDGQAWKGWILGAIAAEGEYEGMDYWIDYRDGSVNWQSPEDARIGSEKVKRKQAALEARSSGKL